jgi:putative DNA primase/helicase
MLGDYATAANPETFGDRRQRDGSAPSEDIARLRGCRFVTVAEPSQQLQLDAARLKQITGGDTITARFLGENSFSYKPEFKLTFNSNVLPTINDMTVFHSERLMVVPFDKHFKEEEQDKTLKRTLREPQNLSAVLNWALKGLETMREKGLKPSAAMSAMLEEYRIENDKNSRFIADSLPLSQDKGVRIKASDVYSEYTKWCHSHGHRVESQTKFLSALRDRGVEVDKKRPSEGGTTTTVIVGRDLIPVDFKTPLS